MTVSAQTPINRSTGNGVTTVFPYTFKIISNADIEVTVDDVVKTLNVDYTVSGAGVDAGGNVTMTVAPANLTSVVRRRNMALVRNTDYQDQGELPATTLDDDLDSAVLMIQQVDEQTSRAMLLPVDVSGFSTELPTPVADYFLRVNSAGTAFELAAEMTAGALTVTPFIETLLNDSTAADARTTLGAAASGPLASAGITGAAASGANADITSLTALAAGGLPDNSILTADIAAAQVTPAKLSQPFTSGTAVATTSGTSVSFTSLPSWVKRITLNLVGFSTNGPARYQVQLGTGGAATTSGYLSATSVLSTGVSTASATSGFLIDNPTGAAGVTHGSIVFTLVNASTNTWAAFGVFNNSDSARTITCAGSVSLAGTADILRLTTVGADTFDAGSVNIIYE